MIYLDVERARWLFLLDIYGKDEKDDVGPQEKKVLRDLAEGLKREAVGAVRRGRR